MIMRLYLVIKLLAYRFCVHPFALENSKKKILFLVFLLFFIVLDTFILDLARSLSCGIRSCQSVCVIDRPDFLIWEVDFQFALNLIVNCLVCLD